MASMKSICWIGAAIIMWSFSSQSSWIRNTSSSSTNAHKQNAYFFHKLNMFDQMQGFFHYACALCSHKTNKTYVCQLISFYFFLRKVLSFFHQASRFVLRDRFPFVFLKVAKKKKAFAHELKLSPIAVYKIPLVLQ